MHYRPAQNFFRRRLANCSFKLAAFRFRLAGGGRRVVTVDSWFIIIGLLAGYLLLLMGFSRAAALLVLLLSSCLRASSLQKYNKASQISCKPSELTSYDHFVQL